MLLTIAGPVGPEFQVNTFTAGYQHDSVVAMNDGGDFVIAWNSLKQEGNGSEVYAQRYNVAGQAQGGEFRVNTYTQGDQQFQSIAMDADGDFAIAWDSADGQDGGGTGVYAQRYNAQGVAQGGEFRVNDITAGHQSGARIGSDAAGNSVIVWSDNTGDASGRGIYAKRYSAAGVALGNAFRVDVGSDLSTYSPDVAMDRNGNFAVSWSNVIKPEIYGRSFDATGAPTGPVFRADTQAADALYGHHVFLDSKGGGVVVWRRNLVLCHT